MSILIPAVQSGLLDLRLARPANVSGMANLESRYGRGALIGGKTAAAPISHVHSAEELSASYERPNAPR